jgi:hypothetical protein
MKKNMGVADRIIRLFAVLAIAILYKVGAITGTLAIVLTVVAVIFLITSIAGICPLYLPFGINTGAKAADGKSK